MIAIMIAGGSGTRLWPVSTPNQPKQFLHIDSSGRSLIQQTYDRVSRVADKVYLVAAHDIRSQIEEHLPEIPTDQVVYEPARRGTANAIYLGLRQVLKTADLNEPLFFLWADHLIRDVDQYQYSLTEAIKAIDAGCNLVQFGIEPTSPSTEFGYIHRGQRKSGLEGIFSLESFKEKPDLSTAKEFFASGEYLWNAGYFMTTASFITQELQAVNEQGFKNLQKLLDAPDSDLDGMYSQLDEAVIDYELSERMRDVCVIACSFDWVDIGNYKDLHAVSDQDERNNYSAGNVELSDVSDSYIANTEDKDIAIVGLDNVVVVNTENGLIVASKSRSADIGKIAKKIIKKNQNSA